MYWLRVILLLAAVVEQIYCALDRRVMRGRLCLWPSGDRCVTAVLHSWRKSNSSLMAYLPIPFAGALSAAQSIWQPWSPIFPGGVFTWRRRHRAGQCTGILITRTEHGGRTTCATARTTAVYNGWPGRRPGFCPACRKCCEWSRESKVTVSSDFSTAGVQLTFVAGSAEWWHIK